jgi:hypothetical protein
MMEQWKRRMPKAVSKVEGVEKGETKVLHEKRWNGAM